jgi:putative radical SAM enzyme (TIGR03279 family)
MPRRSQPVRAEGGLVVDVLADTPAALADVRAGDRLLAVNGYVPRDVIDVRLDAAVGRVELDVLRDGDRLVVDLEKEPDEDRGVVFDSPAFDRMKLCNNACEFCFIRGLPRGLRRSLYLKDDDVRYSFLYGNFVTLTNLTDSEWRRLIFQRLSPLRVSVHATDPELRRRLLRNPRAPAILDQLDELAPHGIRIHAQIVLMPGLNDGPALERTLDDLSARYPTVESAAVVPVGLTRHSRAESIRAVTAEDAAVAIDLVERQQRRLRPRLGTRFVWPGDELYLLAGRPLPAPSAYEDYPQLQNGVGLVQLFRDGWRRAARRVPALVTKRSHVCWATGPLMRPILEELARDLATVQGLSVHVQPVENSLFGGQVSVAGLLPGEDVVRAVAAGAYDRVLLPRAMFDTEGQQTIDGWTTARLAEAVQAEVVVASTAADLIAETVRPPRLTGQCGAAREPALEN